MSLLASPIRRTISRPTWHPGSPLSASLEIVNRRVAALSKRRTDTLHDDVMDFATLPEGGFAQSLMNRFWQVEAGMDDIWPWLPS
jgi:hypothetical protein